MALDSSFYPAEKSIISARSNFGEAQGCENIVALARELHVSHRQLFTGGVTSWIPGIPGMEMPGQNARASSCAKK